MEKAELVGLTLDRLLDHFKMSPESFEFHDNISPTVVWRPKIEQGDITSNSIYDPNNAHAVIVTYNPHQNEITCYVFLTAPAEPLNATGRADTTMSSKRWFETWRSNYRKLMKLKSLIQSREAKKTNLIYLRKLSCIFPDAVDKHLL